ncbi:hypothetical protein DSL72_009013 [Monilinia vaccinii-corymbosi]|uniref:Uncharacterized protein n=1 Tax=Monilinia vaccinii-corymbosi TaxID=61207 RepID=A0A8A3PPI5_9HELO|nr:hypothetical protein DSL72_009013 [Monilinia vaccinii-corymbosi]
MTVTPAYGEVNFQRFFCESGKKAKHTEPSGSNTFGNVHRGKLEVCAVLIPTKITISSNQRSSPTCAVIDTKDQKLVKVNILLDVDATSSCSNSSTTADHANRVLVVNENDLLWLMFVGTQKYKDHDLQEPRFLALKHVGENERGKRTFVRVGIDYCNHANGELNDLVQQANTKESIVLL